MLDNEATDTQPEYVISQWKLLGERASMLRFFTYPASPVQFLAL
jgi:hypothetical protein